MRTTMPFIMFMPCAGNCSSTLWLWLQNFVSWLSPQDSSQLFHLLVVYSDYSILVRTIEITYINQMFFFLRPTINQWSWYIYFYAKMKKKRIHLSIRWLIVCGSPFFFFTTPYIALVPPLASPAADATMKLSPPNGPNNGLPGILHLLCLVISYCCNINNHRPHYSYLQTDLTRMMLFSHAFSEILISFHRHSKENYSHREQQFLRS